MKPHNLMEPAYFNLLHLPECLQYIEKKIWKINLSLGKNLNTDVGNNKLSNLIYLYWNQIELCVMASEKLAQALFVCVCI